MAEKIAELNIGNNGSKWKYLGNAKGGSVSLPSVWNEVLIECTNASTGYIAVGTALVAYEMTSPNVIDYIRVNNSVYMGNVGFSRQAIIENALDFDAIKVYVR